VHSQSAYLLRDDVKKTAPILLLGLLLFNCFGYRLLLSYIENRSDHQFERQLDDNNYDESRLVSLKVPVTYLPYCNNSGNFERIDGQIEIHGVLYKYVKRRIYNDSLELLCIPNATAMKLQTTQNEIIRFVNDLQPGKKPASHQHPLKGLLAHHYISNDLLQIADLYTVSLLKSPRYSTNIPFCYCFTEEHPPQHG
jgi:hypothetical protein